MELILYWALVWILLSGVVAAIASRKDRSGFLWFVVALLFSPLIAGFIILTLGEAGKICPQCAETVKYEAKVCRFCGYTREYLTEADQFDSS